MAAEIKEPQPFQLTKTYTLVELVRGTSPMVNKGPDQGDSKVN